MAVTIHPWLWIHDRDDGHWELRAEWRDDEGVRLSRFLDHSGEEGIEPDRVLTNYLTRVLTEAIEHEDFPHDG